MELKLIFPYSVENVREEVKKLELKQISTPLLSLKEPEIIQDDAQVLEDYSEWDDDEPYFPLETSRRLELDSQEALISIPLRAPKGLKDLKKSPKKTQTPILSPKFKTPSLLSPNVQQSFEQPRSLDLFKTPSKRRGSRKSRSCRSLDFRCRFVSWPKFHFEKCDFVEKIPIRQKGSR